MYIFIFMFDPFYMCLTPFGTPSSKVRSNRFQAKTEKVWPDSVQLSYKHQWTGEFEETKFLQLRHKSIFLSPPYMGNGLSTFTSI